MRINLIEGLMSSSPSRLHYELGKNQCPWYNFGLGDAHKFVSALIVPSFINLIDWAKENNIAVESPQQIVDNITIKDLINKEVDKLNKDFGKWEQIKKFTLLTQEWTIEAGELTPTLKVKRKIILAKYHQHVEDMYSNEHEAD